MKYKKAQGLTIFILIGLTILLIYSILYYTKDKEVTLELDDVDEKVIPLKEYINNCYLDQQQALLFKVSILEALRPLDHYKGYFRQFVLDNSDECILNIPFEIAKEFVTDPSVNDAKVILQKDQTIFVLETNQKVLVDGETEKEIGNYIQKHDVHLLKLHNHSMEITKDERVRFDYLKQRPINNKVYRVENEIRYLLNDSASHIDFQQYLFLFNP